jgi:hypothetical protein
MEVPQGNSAVAILNKQKCHFFFFVKSENRRAEQILPGTGWGACYQWEGAGSGESVWEGEYSANTVYTCM